MQKLIVVFIPILLFIAGCTYHSDSEQNFDLDKQMISYHWTERLESHATFLQLIKENLKDKQALTNLFTGYFVATQRDSFFQVFRNDAIEYLKQVYSEAFVNQLFDVHNSVNDLLSDIQQVFQDDQVDLDIEELGTKLDLVSHLILHAGSTEYRSTNSDLNLYNVFAFPNQVSDKHSMTSIADLIENINDLLEEVKSDLLP
ncbi:hypothetical protein [Bacillus horti]|uniref:Uncharacterized protein YdcH (DUF465 family) n=1 Tax=Caldalkalibacillus horti TaxID=77523 RepID=A0ABT9W442_9BACI|nr:hypothetical protein [Bacillus horti]MDQ0168001.1 uncharacterized protein YdcH (DUF465 family) [Bacillus horti]